MIIFPAVDLYEGKAVRLLRGDYDRMTVYSEHPEEIGCQFAEQGATHVHLVDLEGARSGETPNLETVTQIKKESGLFCEIGGGIRSMSVINRYLDAGLDRVILGTAAVEQENLLREAVERYGEQVAVGVDIRDGFVATRGWLDSSGQPFQAFCTDISRDGAMQGTNLQLYRHLSENLGLQITASGGISSIEDVRALRRMNLYGAIIGKAWYTGAISLPEAIEVAK